MSVDGEHSTACGDAWASARCTMANGATPAMSMKTRACINRRYTIRVLLDCYETPEDSTRRAYGMQQNESEPIAESPLRPFMAFSFQHTQKRPWIAPGALWRAGRCLGTLTEPSRTQPPECTRR